MLQDETRAIIEENLSIILNKPETLSQTSFVNTYNAVYLFCSKSTEKFYIEGEDIYKFIETKILEYTKNIHFVATIPGLYSQSLLFKRISDYLGNIFSYLERFYIASARRKNPEVNTLTDMFNKNLYYNYIFQIEDSLTNLIFLEMDNARQELKTENNELKGITSFYVHILVTTNQAEKLKMFYKNYIENFIASTDFTVEIGKLLKKVYIEMFYATDIMGDKSLCKIIVDQLSGRKEDIFKYAFSKIRNFELFKHVYKVISTMDEQCRVRFKKNYEDFIIESLKMTKKFDEVYEIYTKLINQITSNKMSNYKESLNEIFKDFYIDKGESDHNEISDALVERISKIIENNNEKCNDSLLEHTKNITIHENVKSEKSNHTFVPADESELNILLDIFQLILNDYLIERYAEKCQSRLLNGFNPYIEENILNSIIARVGLGSVSKIKSSIYTYIKFNQKDYPLSDGTFFRISLLKHTKGFWNIPENNISLPATLEIYKNDRITFENLPFKENIKINYQLSPIYFEMNATTYKMNTDMFSIIYHCYEAKSELSIEDLQLLCSDTNFTENLKELVNLGFLLISENNIVSLVNRQDERKFVNLFKSQDLSTKNEKIEYLEVQKRALVESAICQFMKKAKEAKKHEILKINFTEEDINEGLVRLASRGFVSIENDVIKYIP